jgi:hypothetical protein
MLCYVQHLIRSKWPALADRAKDYIRFQNPTDTRVCHLPSSINLRGMEFPFEVQVRAMMHRLAELEAAHWDYKLGSKSDPSLTVKQVVNPTPASFFHPQGHDESADSELPITGGKEAVPVGPRDALVTAKGT